MPTPSSILLGVGHLLAKIAVSAAVYAIDKPYSYRVPQDMALLPGMRVCVPFGRGNRRCEGVVLELCDGPEDKLKPVEEALDAQPVLTARQLHLAAFLRERYFCTFYDTVHAILPVGLWFKTMQTYTVVCDSAGWRAMTARNPAAQAVMQALEELGGCTDLSALRAQFPDEAALQSALRYLLARRLIEENVDMAQRTGSKTEKMLQLSVPADEAAAYAARKQRSAPLQKAVLELLCAVGSASCREVLYLTGASMATIRRLEKLALVELFSREIFRAPQQQPVLPAEEPTLSAAQQEAYDGLCAQMQTEKPGAALLYGVTGSGKTLVYIKLLYAARAAGKSAILLVPEIALTPQLLNRLRAHFGDDVAVLHSSLRVGERYDEWRRVQSGKAHIVVGTRSAVFAPTEHLGLLILDEEQEHSYKSENTPRYHAREVALYRGAQEGALVLLGSATPSVESMYRAQTGLYSLYRLPARYNGRALPQVEIADMKQELRQGNDSAVSALLRERLQQTVADGHQAILFLNRRGNSRCLVCTNCGEAPSCPRCSVHLTYHSANERLMCHYCGYSQAVPERCPQCGGRLKPVGCGTQKVEQELHALLPDVRVLRMDADTVSAENTHEVLLSKFAREKIPILLGTQMVAKGLDFENVTLVGVLDADLSLYFGSFRAAETTFSLVTQVVGRAGRGQSTGTALIQTMTPEHPVLRLAAEQNYDAFYDMEMQLRQLRGFPPLRDIFTLTATCLHEDQLLRSAMTLRQALAMNLKSMGLTGQEAELFGPTPAPVARVNYTYRYRLSLCCKNTKAVRQMLAYVLRQFAKDPKNRGVSAFVDVNSYD